MSLRFLNLLFKKTPKELRKVRKEEIEVMIKFLKEVKKEIESVLNEEELKKIENAIDRIGHETSGIMAKSTKSNPEKFLVEKLKFIFKSVERIRGELRELDETQEDIIENERKFSNLIRFNYNINYNKSFRNTSIEFFSRTGIELSKRTLPHTEIGCAHGSLQIRFNKPKIISHGHYKLVVSKFNDERRVDSDKFSEYNKNLEFGNNYSLYAFVPKNRKYVYLCTFNVTHSFVKQKFGEFR